MNGLSAILITFDYLVIIFAVGIDLLLTFFLWVRLIEKSLRRDEVVNSASSRVTDKVFRRQVDLKKMILEQIQMAVAEERDILHRWRKIIISNTHPR